ncbi:MAG: extracellular solute-binding protein [Spirochaetia bacterium]|nr:extracellular solute-binding protein [Spirochaetia bacterium]
MKPKALAYLVWLVVALALAVAILYSCVPDKAKPDDSDLVVYSSHPEELAKTIIDEFRERTGLRVRVVYDGTGALLSRLGSAQAGDADVLWGGGAESLVANIGLFQPYLSPERAFIPGNLMDERGYWTGFTVLPMVIIYNARLVSDAEAPQRWSDLASPAFAGSIAFANPSTSGSSYTILRTLLVASSEDASHTDAGSKDADDEAWLLTRRLMLSMGGTTLEESSAVYRGVASGEYLVGMTFETAGAEARRLGSDVLIVYPDDGTSAIPDGVAIIKNAPHHAAAKKFVDFVLGYDVARVVSARFKRRSSRFDAPVPEGMPALASIRLVDYDFDDAVHDRERTLRRFESLRLRE